MKLTDQICVINSNRDNGLSYVTYYEDDAKFEKRKMTGVFWAEHKDNPNPEVKIIDNTPIKGVSVEKYATRWRSENKVIRLNDPRGFSFEVYMEEFVDLIHSAVINKGIIEVPIVYGFNNKHQIIPIVEGSELHQQLKSSNKIVEGFKPSDLKPLMIVSTHRINKAVYLGHGRLKYNLKLFNYYSNFNSQTGKPDRVGVVKDIGIFESERSFHFFLKINEHGHKSLEHFKNIPKISNIFGVESDLNTEGTGVSGGYLYTSDYGYKELENKIELEKNMSGYARAWCCLYDIEVVQ